MRYRLACVGRREEVSLFLFLSSQVFCASPAIWYEHAIPAFGRPRGKLAVNLRSLSESLSESAMSELCKLSGVHRSELNSEAAKRQPFRNLKVCKEEHTAKTVEKNVVWVCGWMELLPALAWPRGMPL